MNNTVIASDEDICNSRKQFRGKNRHDRQATNAHRLKQLNKFGTFLDAGTVLSDSAYNSMKECMRKCDRDIDGRGKW